MMNAISLALTNPMGGADLAPPPWVPDTNRYMPAATGTRWPAGFTQTYAADLNYQCSKLFFGSPDYETNDFLIPFVGFGCTEGGLAPQETILPNADIAIDEVFSSIRTARNTRYSSAATRPRSSRRRPALSTGK